MITFGHNCPYCGFNTQPPEGGCVISAVQSIKSATFQHTATRRWLRHNAGGIIPRGMVSTHSHPKVAASDVLPRLSGPSVSTHSHPKVAAHSFMLRSLRGRVSTHSHPKVAASSYFSGRTKLGVSTHSHPKVAAITTNKSVGKGNVSTHSHPKVAAIKKYVVRRKRHCFNTQPPEGGCFLTN